MASSRICQPSRISQCRRPLSYACTARPPSNLHPPDQSRRSSPRSANTFHQYTRHASSAAPTRKHESSHAKAPLPVKASPFIPPLPQVRAKLNPPPETHAPDLSVPPRKDESFIKYLWRCGRLYLAFYKQGVANVRATLRLAKRFRVKAASTKVPRKEWHTVLTRAEWQVVRRSAVDKVRLPAFGAFVLVFGEWTPLLALYITPLIPEACRIPAQVQRELLKGEERRSQREHKLALSAALLVARDRKAGATAPGSVRPQSISLEELRKLDYYSLLSLDVRFGLSWRVWDWLLVTPPKSLVRWGLERRLGYLRQDDWAITRDGGWQALDQTEMQRACAERGIRVLGRKEGELRRELGEWFER